jgi:membrane-associated phospholipid phosphatase
MAARSWIAILGAAAGLALLTLTWYATFHIGSVEHADQSIYRSLAQLGQRPHVNSVATIIVRPLDPLIYVLLCAVLMLVAIARRRRGLVLAIGSIILGANVTTQLLKPLLAHHRAATLLGIFPPPGPSSWPSGHATAAMSFTLCCVLVTPARLRPLVAAVGAAFAVASFCSFLTLEWHYPSDVVAGFLVASIWALLGAAAVPPSPRTANSFRGSSFRP